MSENTSSIVPKSGASATSCVTRRKLWRYLEQLTFLIFLKMAEEYRKPPYSRDLGIPEKYTWDVLKQKRGAELDTHYKELLEELGKKPGMLGQIFLKAQNKISDPAMLYKVIDMIDKESWVMMGVDTKGEIYEGLLQKNAEDTKSGAGQYFHSQSAHQGYGRMPAPGTHETIGDPCCGTGGFFLAAYDFITKIMA